MFSLVSFLKCPCVCGRYFCSYLRTPRRRLRFAGAERCYDACAHFVQSRFDERRLRIVLPKIKELQGLVSARDFGPFKGFLVAADVLPLQEDLASFTNALRWALYSWGDDGERANVFFADFAKDGYQAKGYFGFVDECGDYSPWGHTWAVGTRAELDAAGWAEEAFPNEDVADY